MDWKQIWIDEVLNEVPAGRYRKRAEAELRDHLETQCRAFMDAGRTEDEAQSEALCVMGKPEKLKEEYKTAWRRSPAGLLDLAAYAGPGIIVGCVMMGILYIFTFILLGALGFTYDATIPGRVCYPILSGNKIYVTVFSTVLFLIPFTLGAGFLRFYFRKERRPAGLVTAGLLTAWLGEKAAIISISALIYGMPFGLDLLTRIYHGGDTTAPWFSPVNYVLTFLGCILLGQFFGRFAAQEHRVGAA